MATIEEVLSRMNPKTAAMFRKASELETEILETPSLGINMAIGGLRYGAIHTVWGNRSAGKTLFCLGLAANAQATGKSVGWVDAEKNFDSNWAKRHNVNPEEVLLSQVASIADMADAAVDSIKSGIDLLVVDSMSVLLPQSYFEDGEMKNLASTGQIGTFAKNYGQAVNMINNLNEKTNVVMISQVRNKIGSYGASKTMMGGEAAEFINSTIIKLWSNPNEKEAIQGQIKNGDLILQRPVGRSVTWTINKARGPGMNWTNAYDQYFAGDFVGIDLTGEIIDFGVEFGVIQKGGAWYTVAGERFQGRAKAVQYLRENPEVQERLYLEIMEKGRV